MEMQSHKSDGNSEKSRVAEYLKARVGKPPYEGPTEAPKGPPQGSEKRKPKKMEKESMDMEYCKMCKNKTCPPGEECCKKCAASMDKESAYVFRKAVDILKVAMAPPPGAGGGAPPGMGPPPGGPPPEMGGPPPGMGPPPGGPEMGGPPPGGPEGLMPLPMLLEQLQAYMQMMQGPPPGMGGPPPGM